MCTRPTLTSTTPVVSRFRTYRIELEEEAQAYADAVWALPALQEWLTAANWTRRRNSGP